jgi:translation elongation factor EF-G
VTQGKAEFTLEFASYQPVPAALSGELIERFAERRKDDEA